MTLKKPQRRFESSDICPPPSTYFSNKMLAWVWLRSQHASSTSYSLARVTLCSGTIFCSQAKAISEHVTLDVLFQKAGNGVSCYTHLMLFILSS